MRIYTKTKRAACSVQDRTTTGGGSPGDVNHGLSMPTANRGANTSRSNDKKGRTHLPVYWYMLVCYGAFNGSMGAWHGMRAKVPWARLFPEANGGRQVARILCRLQGEEPTQAQPNCIVRRACKPSARLVGWSSFLAWPRRWVIRPTRRSGNIAQSMFLHDDSRINQGRHDNLR